MKKLLLVGLLGFVLALLFNVALRSVRDPDYLAFDAARTAWHARCDAYVGPVAPSALPLAKACQAELEALLTQAHAKGWDR